MADKHLHSKDCCGDDPHPRVESALSRMKTKALRITNPRLAMLRVLSECKNPISAEEIHNLAGDGTLDLVTVYRNLDSLEDARVVQRHPIERGKNLYALVSPDHHHHHVICRRCGLIEKLPGCDTIKLEVAAKNQGFTDLTHIMEIYGICPRCSKPSHE